MTQNHVQRDSIQPRPKSAFPLERAEFIPRPNKTILRKLFRKPNITGHAQAQYIYPVDVVAVKLFKGNLIASLSSDYLVSLVR